MSALLAYLAAFLVAGWGVAHAIPTRQVMAAFEPISTDNRRIVAQEWLAVLTSVTGARTAVIWFKICPVLLTASAALLAVASWP